MAVRMSDDEMRRMAEAILHEALEGGAASPPQMAAARVALRHIKPRRRPAVEPEPDELARKHAMLKADYLAHYRKESAEQREARLHEMAKQQAREDGYAVVDIPGRTQ